MKTTEVIEAMASAGGSLVEIYCDGVSAESWQSFLRLLTEAGHSIVVTDDDSGEPCDTTMFDELEFDGRVSVEILVGRQTWTSNLWSADVIDLQGDPREILNADDIRSIEFIMSLLNRVTKRRVVFVPETLDYGSVTPYLSTP